MFYGCQSLHTYTSHSHENDTSPMFIGTEGGIWWSKMNVTVTSQQTFLIMTEEFTCLPWEKNAFNSFFKLNCQIHILNKSVQKCMWMATWLVDGGPQSWGSNSSYQMPSGSYSNRCEFIFKSSINFIFLYFKKKYFFFTGFETRSQRSCQLDKTAPQMKLSSQDLILVSKANVVNLVYMVWEFIWDQGHKFCILCKYIK